MAADTTILDRIDVRYLAQLQFDLGEDVPVAKAQVSITCGLYSGVPDRQTIAQLVANRGICEDDIELTGATLTKKRAAAIIAERGIHADDVQSAHIEDVLIDDIVAASGISALSAPEKIDLWDYTGAFYYRLLPEETLNDFFTQERAAMRISYEFDKWWIEEDRASGASEYGTLVEAKAAGDAAIAQRESQQKSKLLAEAGLDPTNWWIDYSDGISFHEISGDRAIVGDVHQVIATPQRWDAYRGDELVATGFKKVSDALAALSSGADET